MDELMKMEMTPENQKHLNEELKLFERYAVDRGEAGEAYICRLFGPV